MYLTTNECNTYLEGKYHNYAWVAATEAARTKAIITAGRLMDSLAYTGEKTDEAQEHQFPRNGDTVIPTDIKNACAEITFHILDGFDAEKELASLSLTSQGFASARSTWDRNIVPEHLRYGIPSAVAWGILKKQLRDVEAVQLTKVS